jgi:hypothetical protein
VTVSGAITEVVYLLGGQEKRLGEPTGADALILISGGVQCHERLQELPAHAGRGHGRVCWWHHADVNSAIAKGGSRHYQAKKFERIPRTRFFILI